MTLDMAVALLAKQQVEVVIERNGSLVRLVQMKDICVIKTEGRPDVVFITVSVD